MKNYPQKSPAILGLKNNITLSTLFTKTNWSWLILELIKALEIKTSMVFNLVFASHTYHASFSFS